MIAITETLHTVCVIRGELVDKHFQKPGSTTGSTVCAVVLQLWIAMGITRVADSVGGAGSRGVGGELHGLGAASHARSLCEGHQDGQGAWTR